jgi:alkylation response protein AidB-like acyl-CoA dehydrogenase
LDPDLDDICAGLERFLRAEVDPLHERHADLLEDPRRRYGPDGRDSPEVRDLIRRVREASAAAGFYTMTLPAAVGGAEIGWEGLFRVWEQVFRQCGPLRWLGHHAIAHWTKGPNPLLAELAPEVRQRYLPELLAGTTSMCFAMSEPDAGSDSWMMRTRAVRREGGWSLSGTKQWISNGAHADLAVVFAVTDPEAAAARRGGIGAFVVPTDSPGFSVGGVMAMFGHLGGNEAVLHLDEVAVPDDHVLGDPGRGFTLAMRGVALGRLYNCAKAVGLADWALTAALDFAGRRETFGARLADHQALAFALADRAIALRATRLLSLDCARRLDAGQGARTELAMAKIHATETAVEVVDTAMQLHGAAGFTNELGLAEAWVQVRAARVADGTGEILRRQVARDLLGRRD